MGRACFGWVFILMQLVQVVVTAQQWGSRCLSQSCDCMCGGLTRSSQKFQMCALCLQFQEMVQEYDTKHAIYFKLHQEIQDLSVKVEGLQQVTATSCLDLF